MPKQRASPERRRGRWKGPSRSSGSMRTEESSAILSASTAVKHGQVAEAVPGVPAGIGRGEFAPDFEQEFLESERARGEVADFELLDEGPRPQAPFPGCQGH